jgi:hypothetical protein
MVEAQVVLQQFRGGFLGKASPVHFFWGSFDLAVTRFSGRRAPMHQGGAPNCPDYVMREAYSHECSSCGFWPGGDAMAEPAFYSYAYPAPPRYSEHPVRPRPRCAADHGTILTIVMTRPHIVSARFAFRTRPYLGTMEEQWQPQPPDGSQCPVGSSTPLIQASSSR